LTRYLERSGLTDFPVDKLWRLYHQERF
jgi:hypothetical protein